MILKLKRTITFTHTDHVETFEADYSRPRADASLQIEHALGRVYDIINQKSDSSMVDAISDLCAGITHHVTDVRADGEPIQFEEFSGRVWAELDPAERAAAFVSNSDLLMWPLTHVMTLGAGKTQQKKPSAPAGPVPDAQ